MNLHFSGSVINWRGPSPYFFVALPEQECEEVRELATVASYGWGVIPVTARIGSTEFTTSLFPKDGGYLLPLKDAVRRPEAIDEGDEIAVSMAVRM